MKAGLEMPATSRRSVTYPKGRAKSCAKTHRGWCAPTEVVLPFFHSHSVTQMHTHTNMLTSHTFCISTYCTWIKSIGFWIHWVISLGIYLGLLTHPSILPVYNKNLVCLKVWPVFSQDLSVVHLFVIGSCHCGSCMCDDRDNRGLVTGVFCECDDSECLDEDTGEVCGGMLNSKHLCVYPSIH